MHSITNPEYELLDIEIGIIFGLYGTDLDVKQIKEYLYLEFDEHHLEVDIEDYLISKAKEQTQEFNQDFTIEWTDLIH